MTDVRVVIVDDHPVVARGTVEILGAMPGIHATGFALDLEDAVRVIARDAPDVVLCDVMLGDEPRGFDLPALLGDEAARPLIVFVSQFTNDVLVERARAVGAAGYMSKTAQPETMRATILAVAAGSTVFPRRVASAEAGPRLPSPRELDVLRHVAEGRSNQEIATALGISDTTVESHLERLRLRYGQTNRTQMAVFADRQGWLSAARMVNELVDRD
ncbi:MAG: response regulator transcription factor [Chloroflexota bacterium]